jgi:hypothetical protein
LTDVAGRNDWQSPLYFALAPLALLQPKTRRPVAALVLYAAYIFATWWLLTHRLDRFWLPILTPMAILAGLGADWSVKLGWRIVLASVLALGLASNWIYETTSLAGLNRWTDDLKILRREVPQLASPTLATLDEMLPENARVLLVGQAGVFHMTHQHFYNTVFDPEIIETLARDQTPEAFHQALRAHGITHVLVDWDEIERHRRPGGYGFSDFVQPARFEEWKLAGITETLHFPLARKELFRVR